MKTALGRALLHAPRHLVLDEPTNGLDIPTVRALRTLLLRLRDEGACIIFSSHALEDVRLLCDTIVIVAEGRAFAQGTPDEVCRRASTVSLEDAFVHLTSFASLTDTTGHSAVTFTGTATGVRYRATANGVVTTFGAGPTIFLESDRRDNVGRTVRVDAAASRQSGARADRRGRVQTLAPGHVWRGAPVTPHAARPRLFIF